MQHKIYLLRLVVLIVVFITIVTARGSNAKDASYLKVMERIINTRHHKHMQNDLIIRDILENQNVKRKYNLDSGTSNRAGICDLIVEIISEKCTKTIFHTNYLFSFEYFLEERRAVSLKLQIPSANSGPVNVSVSLSDEPAVCLKRSSGRGIGRALVTICDDGEEKYGALCYRRCLDGYGAVGCCICRHRGCPPEYKDDGVATCIKPKPYGRGAGYPWKFGDGLNSKKMFRRCEESHGSGNCEKSGLIVYPKCRYGFHAVGCCICSPNCPDGMHDIGISCGKSSYGRGGGVSRLKCEEDKEEDAGLCYNQCSPGWHGVGPVCWQNCPNSTPHTCGVMCTASKSSCATHILSIVKSVLKDAWDIFQGVTEDDAADLVEAALGTAEAIKDVMSDPYC